MIPHSLKFNEDFEPNLLQSETCLSYRIPILKVKSI